MIVKDGKAVSQSRSATDMESVNLLVSGLEPVNLPGSGGRFNAGGGTEQLVPDSDVSELHTSNSNDLNGGCYQTSCYNGQMSASYASSPMAIAREIPPKIHRPVSIYSNGRIQTHLVAPATNLDENPPALERWTPMVERQTSSLFQQTLPVGPSKSFDENQSTPDRRLPMSDTSNPLSFHQTVRSKSQHGTATVLGSAERHTSQKQFTSVLMPSAGSPGLISTPLSKIFNALKRGESVMKTCVPSPAYNKLFSGLSARACEENNGKIFDSEIESSDLDSANDGGKETSGDIEVGLSSSSQVMHVTVCFNSLIMIVDNIDVQLLSELSPHQVTY